MDWKTWFLENGGKHVTDAYPVPICNDHGTFLFHRMTINEMYVMFKQRLLEETTACEIPESARGAFAGNNIGSFVKVEETTAIPREGEKS